MIFQHLYFNYPLLFLFFQLESYKEAQDFAKKAHSNIWEYGDITEDDAKEFGLGKCEIIGTLLGMKYLIFIIFRKMRDHFKRPRS